MASRTSSTDDVPRKGDIWIISKMVGDKKHTFAAAIVSVSDRITIRRLTRTSEGKDRHLVLDVEPTGLDYAEFLNDVSELAHRNELVRRIGRLSNRDRRFI